MYSLIKAGQGCSSPELVERKNIFRILIFKGGWYTPLERFSQYNFQIPFLVFGRIKRRLEKIMIVSDKQP